MSRTVAALRRFGCATAHWEAAHPVLWGALYPVAFFAIWAAFGLVDGYWVPIGGMFIGLAAVHAIWWKYLWRPGGRKRVRYERWLEREQDRTASTGWYADPTRRHRVRYMHMAKWTKWVADEGGTFADRGAVRLDFMGSAAPSVRSHTAIPLLTGFIVSGSLGIGMIVAALRFPHKNAWAFISADNTHPVAGTWWVIGAVIVVITALTALRYVPAQPQVSTEEHAAVPAHSYDRIRAFGYSFVPTFALAALAAWATWIQVWFLPYSPILPFAALAAFTSLTLAACVCARRVARVEHATRSTLRSRGFLPPLRGAYIATHSG